MLPSHRRPSDDPPALLPTTYFFLLSVCSCAAKTVCLWVIGIMSINTSGEKLSRPYYGCFSESTTVPTSGWMSFDEGSTDIVVSCVVSKKVCRRPYIIVKSECEFFFTELNIRDRFRVAGSILRPPPRSTNAHKLTAATNIVLYEFLATARPHYVTQKYYRYICRKSAVCVGISHVKVATSRHPLATRLAL